MTAPREGTVVVASLLGFLFFLKSPKSRKFLFLSILATDRVRVSAALLARSRPIFEKGAPYLNRLFRLPEPDHREETLRSRRLLLLTVPSFFVFLQIGPVSAFLWNSQNCRNRCPLLLSVPSFCSCLQLGRVSAFFLNLENYLNRLPLLLSVPSFCSF